MYVTGELSTSKLGVRILFENEIPMLNLREMQFRTLRRRWHFPFYVQQITLKGRVPTLCLRGESTDRFVSTRLNLTFPYSSQHFVTRTSCYKERATQAKVSSATTVRADEVCAGVNNNYSERNNSTLTSAMCKLSTTVGE